MNQTTRERKKERKKQGSTKREEEEDVQQQQQQQQQQHSGVAHELAVGDGDGERVAQVRDQRILAGEGDRSGEAHSERDVQRGRVPVGDILLPRRQEPGGQLSLRVGVHRPRQRRHRRQGALRAHAARPERQRQAQGPQPLR